MGDRLKGQWGRAEGATPPDEETLPLPRRGLLDRDWQKALVVLLTLLAGIAVLWVLWQVVSPILHTLILFALAAVLAFALSGPVDVLTRRVGNRVVAIVAEYVLVGIVVVAGLTLLAGPFVRQASDLAAALPQYANDLQARAPEVQSTLGQYGIQTDIDQLKARVATAIEQGGTDVLKHLVGTLAEVGGMLLDVVLALVISLYLLVDGPKIRERSLAIIPTPHRAKAPFLQDNISGVLGGYLRGQLTLALIIGCATGVGTALLGLPYAIVLGVLAGLFELVPMFGPILSAVPAVLVALFMPFPPRCGWCCSSWSLSRLRTTCWHRASAATPSVCIPLERCSRCSRAFSWPACWAGFSPCLLPVSSGCCWLPRTATLLLSRRVRPAGFCLSGGGLQRRLAAATEA
jgi:predicted PurR-regulated permease PerM